MMKFIDKPWKDEEIFELLNPIVREWFKKKFKTFCLPQKYGVMPIHNRENILISAPTGSGKTLTGFLSILNELIDSAEKGILKDKVYCVYLSPLKSLNNDVFHNLITPLKEMEEIAGKEFGIRIAVRTGDTTQAEKAKMLKCSPHILITTPESLSILLSSPRFVENLRNVDWCIVDETHALAENKRGVHLSLSLEKLQEYSKHICRIGLSACLHHDEYITLSDGTIVKIGEFVENLLKKEKKKWKDLEYSNVKDVSIFSVNKEGKLVPSKVYRAWRIPHKDELAEVTLCTGKKIKITLNDKFLTLKNGKLIWKIVNSFKKGDFIAIPKKIKTKGEYKGLLDYILDCNEVFTINPHKLIRKITDKEAKNRKCTLKALAKSINIPYEHFSKLRRDYIKSIPLPILKKILSLSSIEKFNVKLLCGRTSKHFVKYPSLINPDFMRLFGLIASDGHVSHGIISFSNNNKNLMEEVNNLFEKLFGRKSFIRIHSKKKKNSFRLTFKSVPVSHIFKNLGLNFGNKCRTMKIHPDIISLHEEHICAFISGFLDGDGCVNHSRQGGYFRLHSYSKNFIEQMYYCFVRLGIHPAIITQKRKDGIIYYLQVTSARDRKNLSKLLKYKGKADKLEYNIEEERRTNFIPIGDLLLDYKKVKGIYYKKLDKIIGAYSHDIVTRGYCSEQIFKRIINNLNPNCKLRKKLIKIKNFDISFEKIKKIKIINNDRQFVYDLSIEKNHNFVSSNIIVHNTISPLEEIAKFLVGLENGKQRLCKIVDVQFLKKLDLKVLSPVNDLINISHKDMHHKMYELLDKLIQQHKTTLIFTNTRSATERVVHHLKDKFPKNYTENIGAHHGSLSKEHRLELEQRMREGKLKAVVSSTSLELGIDIGYIDLVVLLSSPKSVARSLQRCGRSGHRLHDTTKGRLVVMDRDDLIECSLIQKYAIEKKIDKIHIPTNCLDVLAQQIYGIAIAERIHIKDLYSLIKRSYCYKNLERQDFIEVVEYLTGSFTSLEDRHVYAKIWHDEETGMIGKKGKLARVLYMTNLGTIPDETFVKVKIGDRTIGKIDEGFLERLKRRDIFVLGGQVYEFLFSRGMVAQVRASPGRPPTIPSWHSDMLPLSFDLAMGIQKFRKLISQRFENKRSKKEILEFINEYLYIKGEAAEAIYNYCKDQHDYISIPHEGKIIIENHIDENDKKIIVFHTLYGRRVNDVLSRALAFAISRSQHRDIQVGITDNGFYLTCEKTIQPLTAFKLLKSKELRQVMKLAIEKSEVLKRRFRHCATRALMILRQYKGHKKRVGRQQVSSMILLNAVRRISEDFSILKEARREVLKDLMDIDNATKILEMIEKGKIKVEEVETRIPSPFALNLVIQGKADIIKVDTKQEFLKRMHTMLQAKIALEKGKKKTKD